MTAPNMAAITASLERSLQSFSLNNQSSIGVSGREGSGSGIDRSSSSSESQNNRSTNSSDATLELNSNITLPYHWEQCLDLKTGEVYYINWRTGMKSQEDPRTVDDGFSSYFYTDDEEDEEEEEEGEEESSFGSGGSSVESSPAASSSRKQKQNQDEEDEDEENEEDDDDENESRIETHVLVVAGCKGCFMYFMVPKQVEDCPKCCGQLIHFDRSDDNA
ncbi:hypothetical protein LXL04_028259 [Taraxacum kok-saghyz]